MSETTSDFLTELAKKIAVSDAKADAELADIMAGRPYKKRAAPKAESAEGEVEKKAPAVRKPRAKRAPAKKSAE